MNYHSSNFSEIVIFLEKQIIIQNWHKKTSFMTDNQFLKEMSHLKKAVVNHNPCSLLVNMSEFRFIVSPELQLWVNKNVNKSIVENKIKKVAFVRSQDDIAAISVNQTITEDEGLGMNSKIFNSADDAEKWLSK
ncbi:MAG: hypothetical protein JXL97_14030 [Bacteroidales bacterium]|nr:hypothetical protein [Bacteroidales bacterium]